MCWADKAAVTVSLTFWVLVFAIAQDKAGMFEVGVLREIAGFGLVIWIPLRLVDWLIGGPARRAAARQRLSHTQRSPAA